MTIYNFIKESNGIEGIYRDPSDAEISALQRFLFLKTITVDDLYALQTVFQPKAPLRTALGMDVWIGGEQAPPGGPTIKPTLIDIIDRAQQRGASPWLIHCQFESLHPFMDGNGRTGRALWLWMMQRKGYNGLELPFLQYFYYQTLKYNRV